MYVRTPSNELGFSPFKAVKSVAKWSPPGLVVRGAVATVKAPVKSAVTVAKWTPPGLMVRGTVAAGKASMPVLRPVGRVAKAVGKQALIITAGAIAPPSSQTEALRACGFFDRISKLFGGSPSCGDGSTAGSEYLGVNELAADYASEHSSKAGASYADLLRIESAQEKRDNTGAGGAVRGTMAPGRGAAYMIALRDEGRIVPRETGLGLPPIVAAMAAKAGTALAKSGARAVQAKFGPKAKPKLPPCGFGDRLKRFFGTRVDCT